MEILAQSERPANLRLPEARTAGDLAEMTEGERADGNSQYTETERQIADRYFAENYNELLAIARQRRRRAGFADTFSTSDLLHETYLKLTGRTAWQSHQHFLSTAALAIRQAVVDHARRKAALRRNGGQPPLSLDASENAFLPEFNETPEQIVVIGDLLTRLAETNPRWLRIVDCRYFSGMTEAETAATLGLSERTVRRDWVAARAWLADQMR